jgi:hypothetical protein
MPSWQEIQSHARSKYKLSKDEDDFFTIVFGLADDRSHLIKVAKFESFGEDWLEFRAVICKMDEMSPKVALRKNANLTIGSIALTKSDTYVLLHNAPLKSMDMSEFERPLQVITTTADKLESQFSGDNDKW